MAAALKSESSYKPVCVEACDCLTALGNAKESSEALLKGTVALKPTPVLGKDGGDPVPLAFLNSYDETIPPRWEKELDQMVGIIPEAPWGNSKYPVFITSSNFDVGGLYAYRNSGNEDFLNVGNPVNCLKYLKGRYGWAENSLALSHACVTANLGIEMACRYLDQGMAEKVLVFSFDYISPFVAGGFHSLKILNEQFPAPYQDRETGSIGLGDGAGFVVLSKSEKPFRILSNFLYNEMFHFTANDPSGSGFKVAADWLKRESGERPVWIKGHGTGTIDAARLEAEGFNQGMPHSPLVSWKGSIGHTLGSCGIVELAIALASIEGGQIPGTVGSQLPAMTENVSIQNFSAKDYKAVATFSNAFGGAHAGCLIGYE